MFVVYISMTDHSKNVHNLLDYFWIFSVSFGKYFFISEKA